MPTPSDTQTTTTLQTWIPTGSFASSALERVPRRLDEVPEQPDSVLATSGVRNGHVSAQIAVTSERDIADLRVHVSDLHRHGGTGTLERDAIRVRYPQFVPVVDGEAGEVTPAPLPEPACVDVPAGQNQPVWLTFAVPATVEPGTYTGVVSISATGASTVTYDLSLEISAVALPAPHDLSFRTNLWFQPDSVAETHGVVPWSEAHWALIETYLRDLASRGQKVINVAITEDPWLVELADGSWHSQTSSPWESLVTWQYDGTDWSFDFNRFDRYIELHHRVGICDEIHVFSLLSFGRRERLTYVDSEGAKVIEDAEPGSSRWRSAWSAFLAEFQAHMIERQWMQRTFLAFDERPADVMAPVTALLQDVAPQLLDKLAIAAFHVDVEQSARDYSMSIALVSAFPTSKIRTRRAAGKTTSFYTIGRDPSPNTVTSTPPIGTRLLGWVAARADLDGMLRWTYNSWPADVYQNGSFRYAQGDEYLVYPGEDGPVASIAWEMLREGIEDAELVSMLRERTSGDSTTLAQILSMVDPHAPATQSQYQALLDARARLVQELERT